MATDLQNRPDTDSGSDALNPGQNFYDREFAGITSPENYGKSASPDDLRGAEAAGSVQDKLGQGFTAGAGATGGAAVVAKIGKGLFSTPARKKKTIGGGVAGGGIIAIIISFGFLQGPFQAVQFAQFLQNTWFSAPDDAGDNRSNKFMLYALAGKPAKGRLGVTRNIIADRTEKRMNKNGVKSIYGASGRLVGYQIIDADKAKSFVDDMEREGVKKTTFGNSDIARDVNGEPVDKSKGSVLDLRDTKFSKRRAVTKAAMKTTGLTKVSSFGASRIMGKRGGINFHVMNNERFKKKLDTYADKRALKQQVQEERAKERANGARKAAGGGGAAEGGVDAEGKPLPPDPQDSEAAGNGQELNSDTKSADTTSYEGKAKAAETKSKFAKKLLTRGGGALAAVGAICSVKDLSKEAKDLEFRNNILVMQRMGMEVITVGSQVMSGQDLSMEELGILSESFYDEKDKTSWTDSASVQAEMGKPVTGPDIHPDAKPSKIGELPTFFKAIDAIPLGPACRILGGIGNLPIIKQAGAVANTVLNFVLGKYSPEEIMGRIVNWMADDVVNKFAEGSEFGNYANYGARIAANDQSIATGGRRLGDQEAREVKQASLELQKKDIASMSLYERYFDAYNYRSITASVMNGYPTSFRSIASLISSLPKAALSSFSNLAQLIQPPRALAANEYDYGFPIYGFSIAEQDSAAYENPYANAEIVEVIIDYKEVIIDKRVVRLPGLNQTFGNDCFGLTVQKQTGILTYGEPVNYQKIPEKCQDASGTHFSSEELLRYRFYISDMIAANSISCYEGNDATACAQIGFGSQEDGNHDGNIAITLDGFAFPLKTSRSAVQNNSLSRWCFASQANCHHDYNAADIFVPTGTIVLAAKSGTVTKVSDNDGSRVGSRVTIKGDDGNLYYYTHMGDGTISVSVGQAVSAGDEIGKVGTSADAVGTDPHLHMDILPNTFTARPSCSGADCAGHPFINPQPALIAAFEKLP